MRINCPTQLIYDAKCERVAYLSPSECETREIIRYQRIYQFEAPGFLGL